MEVSLPARILVHRVAIAVGLTTPVGLGQHPSIVGCRAGPTKHPSISAEENHPVCHEVIDGSVKIPLARGAARWSELSPGGWSA